MEPFTTITAVAAPLLRSHVDTDSIIPSRELQRVSKQGLSAGLFANWRYTDPGRREEEPGFILNQAPYRAAEILLSGANFGCGSSREHAVWALREWGVRCVIAPSFGLIFHDNCVRNGVLPVVLGDDVIEDLARQVEADPGTARLRVSLENSTVTAPDGTAHAFDIRQADREMLLGGLDAISVTSKHEQAIFAFQERDRLARPWVYGKGR